MGMASADFGAAVHEAMTFQNRGWMQSISDSKQSPGSGDYPVGKINFTGTEQSYVTNGSATASTAALTVAGGGQQKKVYSADCSCFIFVVNSTQLYLTVGGYTVSAVSNSNTDTAANMASQFAAGLNQSGSPVTATLSGVNLTLTSKTTGTAANYSISSTSTYDTTDFNAPAFSFSALPAAMAGGTGGPTTVYDQGTVSITVGGHTTHASWGSSDTPLTVASNVAAAINADSSANVTASAWSGQLTVTSKVAGGSGTYSYSVSTSPGTGFTSASFTGTAIGSALAALTYTVSLNRALNGDVIGSNDSVNGVWSYTYDEFNRLISASRPAIGSSPAQSMSWDYDRYGNRWDQNILAGSGIASHPTFTGGNNRVDSNLYTYDPAGNLRNDGINTYTYDAEGRIFQVGTTKYAYDADGLRVAKYSGSTLTNQYLYNLGNQAVAELNSSGTWVRTEIYAQGTYIGTYDNSSGTPVLTYAFGDWLGTIRARTGTTGAQSETNMSLPFGDSLATSGTESSHKHFTGKLHDDETGLDYFGARYYSGGQGRFLTPDWSASPEAVPYGHFETPQTLNLYAYVRNNPITDTDPDGHDTSDGFVQAQAPWALSGSKKFDEDEENPLLTQKDRLNNGNRIIYAASEQEAQQQKLDPDSTQCRERAASVDKAVKAIYDKEYNLGLDKRNLKDFPDPTKPLAGTIEGHETKLDELKQTLANRANDYNNKCGGDPPTPPGSPTSSRIASLARSAGEADKKQLVKVGFWGAAGALAIRAVIIFVGAAAGAAAASP
jgi:RHS repeat-associated protein